MKDPTKITFVKQRGAATPEEGQEVQGFSSSSGVKGFSSFSSAEGATCSSNALTTSNIGFQLLRKSGWKEGSGLGVAEQGRLEPLATHVKYDKRGLGAKKASNVKTEATSKLATIVGGTSRKSESMQLGKPSKKLSKRLRKELEKEKLLQEQAFQRDFFREFWPDNV